MRISLSRALLATAIVAAVVVAWWTSGAAAREARHYVSRQVISEANTPGQWRYIGPTPIATIRAGVLNAGRAISFAVDPGDSKHWLAGAATGGIWESRDSGASWTTSTDGFPSLAIGALAFAPNNPRVIYAGTGEGNFSRDAFTGVGLYKSTDGGASWSVVGASHFAYTAVGEIRVHPNDANTLLAITIQASSGRFSEPVPYSLSPALGVLKSTDGGSAWVRTLAGEATDLEIHPADFNLQYAAIGKPCRPVCTAAPGSVDNGVYRSADGGNNWKRIDGPWVAMAPTTGRIELAVSRSNPEVAYAGIQGPRGNNQRMLGLFRTDNAWAETPAWVQIPLDATGPTGYCDGQCGSSHSITVDPANPSIVFAGGVALWRCSNCGSSPSWKNVGLTGNHVDHRALEWVGNRLIDVNDGGVQSSVDRGDTWQHHNATMATVQIHSGALHPTNPTFVLAGTKDNACLRWTSGTAWAVPSNSLGVGGWHGVCEGDVAISASHPDTDWMVSADFAQIHRTRDGRNYSAASGGITEPPGGLTASVRKCRANDDVFLTGNTRLWRTNNFFSASEPVWAFNGPESAASVRGIAFSESDGSCNTYAFGTILGNVWLTTNGGNSWTGLPGNTLPGRTVSALAFDPRQSSTLYAGLGSFDGATPGRAGHVFKTTNALATPSSWTNVSPPEDRPANVIVVDPKNPSIVYLGSDLGVWQSSDGATTWRHMGPEVGMPNVPVHDLKIHPMTGEVFAFTFGRGVFVLSPR